MDRRTTRTLDANQTARMQTLLDTAVAPQAFEKVYTLAASAGPSVSYSARALR